MRRHLVQWPGLLGVASVAIGVSSVGTGCSSDDSASAPADAGDAGLPSEAATQDTGASDAPNTVDASKDAGVDAAPLTFLDGSVQCAPDGGHGGHRWQDLYACYFGATGLAACGTMTGCHSNANDDGTFQSNGFVCDPADAGACWQSMTSVLVPDGSASDPVDTTLYTSLRKTDGTGSMPLVPMTLVFQTGDMARISAWITAGAPNN